MEKDALHWGGTVMNDTHMQQIFKHYIDDFEKLNDPEHRVQSIGRKKAT